MFLKFVREPEKKTNEVPSELICIQIIYCTKHFEINFATNARNIYAWQLNEDLREVVIIRERSDVSRTNGLKPGRWDFFFISRPKFREIFKLLVNEPRANEDECALKLSARSSKCLTDRHLIPKYFASGLSVKLLLQRVSIVAE